MDRLILNGTDGFPLYTDTLAEAQRGWSVFNGLTGLAGDLAIIKGCKVTGSQVSDGFVSIDDELYFFKGGSLGNNVIIKEIVTKREFKDKSTKPVYMERYATFGSSTPDKTYAWADFKPVFPTTEIAIFKKSLEDRIKALENKKSAVPIGLIAIWGKPANVPIPEGWQEYEPMRGRMPIGHDPDYFYDDDYGYLDYDPEDYKLSEINATGGKRYHQLKKKEIPAHSHGYWDIYHSERWGSVPIPGGTGTGSSDSDNKGYQMHRMSDENTDANGSHNNMPPYRVIRFIQFVGF